MTLKKIFLGNIRDIMEKWFLFKEKIEEALSMKSDVGHTHGDEYYTKEEIDDDFSHYVSEEYFEASMSGKADKVHEHDDLYYTKSEEDEKFSQIDDELSEKADLSEMEDILSNKSDIWHTHDNFYTKTEEDGKFDDLNNKISNLVSFSAEVVDELPSVGEGHVIYLTPSSDGIEQDLYDEFLYVNGKYEKLGNTAVEVDLSGYATKTELTDGLSTKSDLEHNHDESYPSKKDLEDGLKLKADKEHAHDDLISSIEAIETELDSKSDVGHNHDGAYLSESDLTEALSTKSNVNHTHDAVTTSKDGFMIASDKSKLDGIQAEANKYVLPVATAGTLGGVKIGENITITDGVISGTPNTTYSVATQSKEGLMSATDKKKLDELDGSGGYVLPVASATTLGGVKVGSNLSIDGNGVLSGTADTTYSVASQSANGLMSSTDKKKLDGVSDNANNYSLPTASSSTLGGVKVGSNLTISNGVLSGTADTTYNAATQSANGLMSSTDKKKLDNISDNANNYSLPTASSSTLGGVKVGSNLSISNGVLSGTGDTTYGTASQRANGLMSSTDKKKLDGIADGATKITVDTSMSSSSTNPVQNKVVNSALGGKADSGHSHSLANTNRTLASNFFEYAMGQVVIVSWWTLTISVTTANSWVTLYTLNNKNIGQAVWSNNIQNGSYTVYFRVNANSNTLQYYSSNTGSMPLRPGQLVFITKNSI